VSHPSLNEGDIRSNGGLCRFILRYPSGILSSDERSLWSLSKKVPSNLSRGHCRTTSNRKENAKREGEEIANSPVGMWVDFPSDNERNFISVCRSHTEFMSGKGGVGEMSIRCVSLGDQNLTHPTQGHVLMGPSLSNRNLTL
jgi:hypothetical protein